ncbi:hypothetical protein KFK09_028333 [Dendrobium nobile]|uniref:Uncharacterized protein n=1 Tax=Dendrobium nobile TaxID=94219 RepID=A0A8T3A335_DENNO|nr:hypothetical protein KFK09_028333 [Dendrobium nobile]
MFSSAVREINRPSSLIRVKPKPPLRISSHEVLSPSAVCEIPRQLFLSIRTIQAEIHLLLPCFLAGKAADLLRPKSTCCFLALLRERLQISSGRNPPL